MRDLDKIEIETEIRRVVAERSQEIYIRTLVIQLVGIIGLIILYFLYRGVLF